MARLPFPAVPAARALLVALYVRAGITHVWTSAAGGDFMAAGTWSPNSVPGAEDGARFNLTSAPSTVTWQRDILQQAASILLEKSPARMR